MQYKSSIMCVIKFSKSLVFCAVVTIIPIYSVKTVKYVKCIN